MQAETEKSSCSVEPFTVDWSAVYQYLDLSAATDPITASSWSKSGDVVIDTDSIAGLRATARVSGGTTGTEASITNLVVIGSLGYQFCFKINLIIT